MTRTPCKDTKQGEIDKVCDFSNKWSVIVENVQRVLSSSERHEPREGKDSDTELIEGEESRESLAENNAEDRFFLDIGSLIRPLPNPPSVQFAQQIQGSSKPSHY